MYHISEFEDEMDKDSKKKKKFDIKKYKNDYNGMHNNYNLTRESANTPRNSRPHNLSGNVQNSLVVQAGGFQNTNQNTGNAMNLNINQSTANNAA